MPILANVIPAGPGQQLIALPVDDRRLDFRSLDGSDVLEWTGDEWIIMSGIQGLRLAPRELITETVPNLDGARLREIRTGPRTVILPFAVFASDGDYRTHLDQMASLRQYADFRTIDYAAAEGTFDLVASRGDGYERTLRCAYVDGMEGVDGIGDGNGAAFSTFDMKLLAVAPFWRGEEWSTPVVSLPTPAPFLSNMPGNGFPRRLSASVALGADMDVTVAGAVPSPATIALVGPAASTHISSPQGLDVTIGAIATGETVIVDTGRRKQVLRNGVTDWTMLGDSPQWRDLPPGKVKVSVEVSGATTDTRARVYGTSLWESPW